MNIDEIRSALRREAAKNGLTAADIAGILGDLCSYAPPELEPAVDHMDDAIAFLEKS